MLPVIQLRRPPYTQAVRNALSSVHDQTTEADLLFLESWEIQRTGNLGATLRAGQIRRANPALTAAIAAELKMKQ
jgi:hypothetical protein